jgi:hypothetical protein
MRVHNVICRSLNFTASSPYDDAKKFELRTIEQSPDGAVVAQEWHCREAEKSASATLKGGLDQNGISSSSRALAAGA